jgi:hypothetical protein
VTDQQRQDIIAKLIELGAWGAHEPGDPLTSKEDTRVLHLRLDERLAAAVFMASTGYSTHSPARRIDVVSGKSIYLLANGDNYPKAICLAALALPEFLKQHPECVADRD